MQQPRMPVTAGFAGTQAPSANESPSGLWPLGSVNRAGLSSHERGAQSGATSTALPSLSFLETQIRNVPDPIGFLTHVFASAPIGLAVWKPDGYILLANAALSSLFGSTPPPDYNLFTDNLASELGIATAIRRAFAGESVTLPTFWYDPRELKNVSVTEGRRVAISGAMFPILNGAGRVDYVAAVYRDDTNVMLAQEQLKAQSDQLERHIIGRTAELEEANEELEAFSYSVSHDLRGPVRAIDAFAALLANDTESQLSEKSQDYLRRIRTASLRMGELINDLLSFSRLGKQALDLKSVNATQMVDQVIQELKSHPRDRDVDIRVELLPSCRADPALLREVFMNLIDNAIKFTGKKSEARIDIGTRVQDGQVVWHVADNGVGFDMSHYERLFGVFSRLHTNEEFEGTGVGLALVNRIIKRHGGEIWAYAEPGKGATFYFTLGE
jgi:signal transduction histidine kinase